MRIFRHLTRFIREILLFAWQNKVWWIVPIVLILLVLTLVIAVGSSVAPFIYPLF